MLSRVVFSLPPKRMMHHFPSIQRVYYSPKPHTKILQNVWDSKGEPRDELMDDRQSDSLQKKTKTKEVALHLISYESFLATKNGNQNLCDVFSVQNVWSPSWSPKEMSSKVVMPLGYSHSSAARFCAHSINFYAVKKDCTSNKKNFKLVKPLIGGSSQDL